MKHLKEFIIPFVGLKTGKHHFDFDIDDTFLHFFEFDDFNSVNVKVTMELEKKSTLMELSFEVKGFLNVNCDVTNEAYNQDITNDMQIVVKFGQEYNDENIDILILPHGEYELNIQQYVYELIVLALPAKRVHPGVEDGTLESEILEKLDELSPKEKDVIEKKENTDPRWDKLKKLLTDK
mgnify:CR=1 FL=1|tara:strand:- start:296 stop:835 length:540 start_codon:yes stop_codon:yes gene_type:complete